MTDLNLYKVTVSQEWVSTQDVYILEVDSEKAEAAAMKEVDLDIVDAEDAGSWASSRVADPNDVIALLEKKYPLEDFIIPDRCGSRASYNSVPLKTFLSHEFFSEETLRKAHIARIEKNNGQIPLPLT